MPSGPLHTVMRLTWERMSEGGLESAGHWLKDFDSLAYADLDFADRDFRGQGEWRVLARCGRAVDRAALH
jgi:hypothetical protein